MLLLVAMILLLLVVVVVVVGGANWFGGIKTGVLQGKTTVARSGTVNNKLLSRVTANSLRDNIKIKLLMLTTTTYLLLQQLSR